MSLSLTPPEGVRVEPGDKITVDILQPWYLRWLPSAKLTFHIDEARQMHVSAKDIAA